MSTPNGVVKLQIEIPQEVYNKLQSFIEQTIHSSLQKHLDAITATPPKITRAEAAAKLRVSLPTLDSYTKDGKIKSQRIGRRVLFDAVEIERFLKAS